MLVLKYICLSKEDLEFWKDEPEQFVQEEEADHWEYNVRVLYTKLLICSCALRNWLLILFLNTGNH